MEKVSSIFKAYDIRGRYPKELNASIAFRIGRSLAKFFKSKSVVVGRDCRLSSEELSKAVIEGLTAEGVNVIHIGLCSTPVLYFASKNNDAVMVTASHLPKGMNGFKIVRTGVVPVGENSGLLEIRNIFETPSEERTVKKGNVSCKNIVPAYVKHIQKFCKNIKPVKIVIDAGNGTAGYVLPFLVKDLPIVVTPLFFARDGNFPNRSPNPMGEGSLNALCEEVLRKKADVGVAFDGDADRIVFVDECGEIIQPDVTLALLVRDLIKKKDRVVYDLTCSKVVPEAIREKGGDPIISRVGHTFIQEVMRRKKAVLGGEKSGHYFFKDNFYADSGDITLMMVLSLLSRSNKKLSELVAPLKKYHDIQKSVKIKNFGAFVASLKTVFKRGKLSSLDGVTIEFSDWWFNCRYSNTERAVRITIEAGTQHGAETKLKKILSVAEKFA